MKPVAAKILKTFDPKTFLSTIDGGRKIVALSKKQAVFVQGDSSDAVLMSFPSSGRKSRSDTNWATLSCSPDVSPNCAAP